MADLNVSPLPPAGAPAGGPQGFRELAQSLQSGDLAGAQKAFAALQQRTGIQPPPEFQALAQSLQSGDLAGAQKAFAALQQARQGHHHHHHRPEGEGAAPQAPGLGGKVDVSL